MLSTPLSYWTTMFVFLVLLIITAKAQWIKSSTLMPSSQSNSAIAAYQDSLFLITGLRDFYIYHIGNDTFSEGPPPEFSVPSRGTQWYTSSNNMIYMKLSTLNTLVTFNLIDKTYDLNFTSTPISVSNPCLSSTDDYLFIIGGYFKDDVQVFDLWTMKWISNVSSLNTAREPGTCIVNPDTNKLYVISGYQYASPYGYSLSNEVIYIDDLVAGGNWTEIDELPVGLRYTRSVIYENIIYIIGGYLGEYNYARNVYTINTINDTVSTFANLRYKASDTAAILVDSIIYAFGGWNGVTHLDTWMYYDLGTLSPTMTTSAPTTDEPTTANPTTPFPTGNPITFAPTTEPTTFAPTTPDPTSSSPTTYGPSAAPSIPPEYHCDNITVEIINLDGIISDDFEEDQTLSVFMVNITTQAIWNDAINYGFDDNSFYIQYESVSDDINITLSICGETQQVLGVLNDIIVDNSDDISDYIKNQTIKKFEALNDVSTNNLTVNIFWRSDAISIDDTSTATVIEIPSLYVTVTILALFFVFALVALFDAKFVRKNDYFLAKSIIISGFEVSDTVTDLLFAVALLLRYFIDKGSEILTASIGAFVFLIIPITYSIIQLIIKARKSWLNEHGNWLKQNGKMLFLFSFLTGSSYTACEIVNCGAFQLEVFSMGLNKQERIKFSTKRVIGVVCLENIPQMIIQIWYLARFGVDYIAILSLIFSVMSIILTVLTTSTQRAVIRNQDVIRIQFDVIGNDIKPILSTMTAGIRSEIGVLLGIKGSFMEIYRPKMIPKGLKFEILLFLDGQETELNFTELVQSAVADGALQEIIKKEWSLQNAPNIENIVCNQTDNTAEVELGETESNDKKTYE